MRKTKDATATAALKPRLTELRMLGSKIAVEPIESEGVSQGGILLPDTAKTKPSKGKVRFVGPGTLLEDGKRAPMTVRVGETVLFPKYGGTEIKLDTTILHILDEDQLLAVIDTPREGTH